MATTETKTGFRLPWSSDRSEPTSPAPGASAEASAAAVDPADPSAEPVQEIETPEMIDAVPAATAHEAAVETPAGASTAAPAPSSTPSTPASASRKPNKFMAELTRAMQSAAEAAREETLAKFSADAKAHVEGIHTEAASEATELRKQADDDVAGIRDWSKAEIARIREETDERIAHRKQNLENELEEHAASIERRIERVQARVTNFETEMAAFFERLLAEEDPTRFAAMAEALPEPPPFDGPMPDRVAAATPAAPAPVAEAPVEAPVAPVPSSNDDWGAPAADWGASPAVTNVEASAASVPAGDPAWDAPITPDPAWGAPGPEVAETPAAFAPDPTWDDPAGTADAGDAPAATEVAPVLADQGDLFGITAADVTPVDVPVASPMDDPSSDDPRLSALGLPADFAAAEAEAADFTPNDDGSEDEVPSIPDDAIASRLAGLVPEDGTAESSVTTRVSVTGLISVASIAGFKRHLSRAPGVQSVGVSSGPDGEFVFAVVHAADADLRDVVTTLPGFGARVTEEGAGALTVAAHDPEAEG